MKKIVYLFFVLFTINHLTFTMNEKPLKNKKIQQFEAECKTISATSIKGLLEKIIYAEDFMLKCPCELARIKSPNLFSRPLNIPVNSNDPTELLIYTEKIKILLHQAKK